eukprot:4019645-Pleurochrysis_carterae.AAC.1
MWHASVQPTCCKRAAAVYRRGASRRVRHAGDRGMRDMHACGIQVRHVQHAGVAAMDARHARVRHPSRRAIDSVLAFGMQACNAQHACRRVACVCAPSRRDAYRRAAQCRAVMGT